jgi:hypothetical protein
MRFPAAAHEKLFLRTLNEMDSNTVQGVVSTLALFTLVSQIKHLGDDRYDLATPEGQQRTLAYLAANNYLGGSLVTGADTISSLLTGSSPLSEYRAGADTALGVTANLINKTHSIAQHTMNGEPKSAFVALHDLTNHIPVVESLCDWYLKEGN